MRFNGSWRKIARRVHLYLGLSIGGALALIALTGSILVYYPELDENISSLSTETARPINWDTSYQTLKTHYPDKQGSWRLESTKNKHYIPARYYNQNETVEHAFAPLMVWLSPDGRLILREDVWGNYFVTWIYNVHFSLLAGSAGTIVIGYIGIGSLILLISGLCAWWPKKGQWAKSLKFKARSSLLGLLYDWHKLLGLIFALPLILLTATGIMLAIPNQTDLLITALLGNIDKPNSAIIKPQRSISLSAALGTAQEAMPNTRLAWVGTPSNHNAVYRFRFKTKSDPSYRFPHSYVQVNASTGELISVFNIDKMSVASKFKNWLHPLHNGSIGDQPLRILWVLSGVATTLLFALGLFRWLIKTKRFKYTIS